MEKRKHLYWTPCAAHTIDLMLEDIAKVDKVADGLVLGKKITSFIYNSARLVNLMKAKFTEGRELLRPGITRFCTEYIAMESLYRYRKNLKQLFVSDEWHDVEKSVCPTKAKRAEAKEVVDIVLQKDSWKKIEFAVQVMEPLAKVLKLVDQDKKPTMPILYEAIDRAKLALQNSVKHYKTFWKIIDNRWDNQLHQDIHAAGIICC